MLVFPGMSHRDVLGLRISELCALVRGRAEWQGARQPSRSDGYVFESGLELLAPYMQTR